ncbi:MAG: stage III sporulation protein AG [Gemmiger sp.]|nr:stage III sporulation protein AG [Gemmiger sp.]
MKLPVNFAQWPGFAGVAAWAKALLADEKRRMNALILLGVAGMLLLALSEWLPNTATTTTDTKAPTTADAPQSDYAKELETRLTVLLSQLEGAGRVEVMVTLAAGAETIYAEDTQTDANGGQTRQHLLLGDGENPALVERVDTAVVQGVAVLCDGGGQAGVAARITEMVTALTGVGASHISVAKLSASN